MSEAAERDAQATDPEDAAAINRRVIETLERWSIDPGDGFTAERQLASAIDDALAADPIGPGRHEVRVTPAGAADVAVDDAVGVLLLRDLGPGKMAGFSRTVGAIAESFDYLVVLGYDLPKQDLDRWRMGKARYTASRADLEDVTYLTHARGEERVRSGWPSTLWHYAEPLVALLAIIIGIEIAILIQLQTGGFEPILGPVATVLTAAALMAMLVLLYQRTEL